MYRTNKMTKEERLLFSKAADDAESILTMSYHLAKFLAEIKAYPAELKSIYEVINTVGYLRDSMQSVLRYDNEKK